MHHTMLPERCLLAVCNADRLGNIMAVTIRAKKMKGDAAHDKHVHLTTEHPEQAQTDGAARVSPKAREQAAVCHMQRVGKEQDTHYAACVAVHVCSADSDKQRSSYRTAM